MWRGRRRRQPGGRVQEAFDEGPVLERVAFRPAQRGPRVRWLCLLLLPTVAGQPLLVAVAPDLPGPGPGDEGIAVRSDVDWNLAGYALTDGESTWQFPPEHLAAGETAWAVGDANLWRAHDGPQPRFTMDLRLGNDGDQVELVAPDGRVVDGMAWGDRSTPHQVGSIGYEDAGVIYRRDADTDRVQDWISPRIHRIGESDLEQPSFLVDRLTLYSSPDSSHEVLLDLIRGARERLVLHVYELRSISLVDAMVEAMALRPLDVAVLVEDAPVAMDAAESAVRSWALGALAAAGASIVEAGAETYRYHHLKVLIADDAVAVQSENWVDSGTPPDPSTGNRGWGVVLHDGPAADWFAHWMEADREAWDATPWSGGAPRPTQHAPRTGVYDAVPALSLQGQFWVTPFISPDHTATPAPLAALLADANDRIWTQQLDVRTTATNALGWSDEDVLFQGLAAAASRGLDVRVLAATPFSNSDDGNRPALEALTGAGAAAKEMQRPGIGTLHNKGMVVDDAVWIGSMNGNHHSRSNNREVSVWIEGKSVADWYASLFQADWDATHERDWSVPLDDLRGIPVTPVPILLAIALVAVLRRCSPSSP